MATTNTYCEEHPYLAKQFTKLQTKPDLEDELTRIDNRFRASTYSVVHFVLDMPLRVPPEMLKRAPAQASNLGPVIFVLTEFQILDRHTELRNELGTRAILPTKSGTNVRSRCA